MSVLELQESGSQPYMILEFVASGSLSDQLQKAGKLPPKDAAVVLVHIAGILTFRWGIRSLAAAYCLYRVLLEARRDRAAQVEAGRGNRPN